MTDLDLSVVIPVRNERELLLGQLAALGSQCFGGSFEVIVADNGSTDGTPQAAAEHAHLVPHLRVVDASGGVGVNHARNVGARAARGRFIAYVDADDEVADGWLSAMAAAALRADVVGGALDQRSCNPAHTLLWQPELTSEGLPTSLGFLPFAIGANVGVRRDVLAALGGWDERHVHGCNDVDLSWRAQLAGYRLAYAPDAVVRYRHRAGWRAVMRRAYRHDKASVALYRDYRCVGAVGRRWTETVHLWAWLGVHLPDLFRGPGPRERWCREAGAAAGRIAGSVSHRVVYL